MAAPRLSVILPVYDEARVLESNLRHVTSYLQDLGTSFEVVCVDDGSRDGSGEILARLAAEDERISLLTHPENLGKGAAVRTGMLAARGERVVFMDADLSTPLEELPAFLEALDSGCEVVIGNRRAPAARITRHQSLLRELLGRGFTGLTRILLAPGIHDFTCGFKAFRAEAGREIFRRSRQNGWAFDAELVVIARELGHELGQVPVRWRHEDGSKVRVLRAVVSSLAELLQIRWRKTRGLYR